MKPRVPIETEGRIDLALHGDRQALEDLVRAESPRLHGIAWRITRDGALAEDVVQEVFLRVIEGRSPVCRSGAARAWLARVAAHAAIDLVRRRGARERREEAHAMASSRRSKENEAPDPIVDEEIRALVDEGFGALSIDVRAAIWLNVVEGDPLRKVAKAFGTPLSTLYRRVEDGLGSLRKHLERRGATAVLALPMGDLLRRMSAPEIPPGLAAKVLERIGGGGSGGGAAAGGAAREILEKGAIGMATAGGKKIGLGVIIALLLLLGVGTFVADPFHLLGGRRGGGGPPERTVEPAARPAERAVKAPGTPVAAVEAAPEGDRRAPAAPYGSIVVRVIWGDDKTPAVGVHLYVLPWNDPWPYLHEETAVTDGEGKARIARVHEGGSTIYLDRGGNGHVDVKAGEEREVTIEVPPGLPLRN